MSFETNSSQKRNQNRTFVDHAIRARTVLVIDGETNENLGVMPLYEALDKASKRGLNLLQMGPGNPPTCKILDYGKFKYDESKRLKAAQKKQRETQIEEKEISFKPDTAVNDLKIKAKKAAELMNDGANVRIHIRCMGRMAGHTHMVRQALETFLSFLPGLTAKSVSPPVGGERGVKFSYQLEHNTSNE